jgi:hypothetical protein
MDNAAPPKLAPHGWLEALAESEADLAAGRTVPGETVRQGIRDAIARLEAKQGVGRPQGTTARR